MSNGATEWMLWGAFGGVAQLGSSPPPRLYLIPLFQDIESEGPLAESMGHRLIHANQSVQTRHSLGHRSLEDVTRALDRAVSAEFDGVIFPSGFFKLDFREEIVRRCKSRGLRIVHQITVHSLFSPDAFQLLEELMKRLDQGDGLNLVFGASSTLKDTLIARLSRWPDQVYFTYSVRAGDATIEMLHRLQPFIRERLFFHFPYHLEVGDGNLSVQEVFDLTERIKSRVPGVRVRPLLGCENFDPRVDPTLELEPVHGPDWASFVHVGSSHLASRASAPEISVIIPSYNNRDYVVNTVRHLIRQDLEPSRFEVIVVDDGSNDGTGMALRTLIEPEMGRINFKYIHSPRLKPRKMGDANYRAGISRNLGVKNAKGHLLCFLDSDILTPRHYLRDLIELHKRHDVIQCKRLNLVREKSDDRIDFSEINRDHDTFHTENGYWEHFYSLKTWSSEPYFWKYTCTYGLSMPSRLFKRVGWIRRGFVFYGFEDVELGYRLARIGARFYLNPVETYHLFHRNERSEFHNSDYLRQSLLAKTAQIFYLGLLEPDVFIHFRGLMKEQIPFVSTVRYVFKKLGFPAATLGALNVLNSVLARFENGPAMEALLALRNRRWFAWHLIQKAKNSIAKVASRVHFHPNLLNRVAHLMGSALGPFKAQSWRVKIVAQRTASALKLWRLRVWSIRFYGTAKKYRSEVAAELSRGFAKVQLWRVNVEIKRLAGELWRLRVFGQRLLAAVRLWKLRVAVERFYASIQIWRLRVLIQRKLSALQLWRFRVLGAELVQRLELWRLRKVAVDFWGYSVRVSWILSYPIRKIYYVTQYQLEKFSKARARSQDE